MELKSKDTKFTLQLLFSKIIVHTTLGIWLLTIQTEVSSPPYYVMMEIINKFSGK